MPAGGTLNVPACLYRETITIRRPMTLDGSSGAEIRGSDVWTGWTRLGAGNTWVSALTVPGQPFEPTPTGDGRCGSPPYLPTCLWPERVWVDGVALKVLVPNSVPSAGQFALDPTRHIVLGADPSGHQIEVGTRERWV